MPADAAPADPAAAPMPVEAAPAPAPEAAPMPEQAPPPAPVVAPVPPPPAPETGEESGDEDKVECAFGDLCVGPVLSLGLINPLGFGAHARYAENWGFGLDYQFVPSLNFGDASAGWSLFTVEGRWYPFGGAFFLGAGFGYQSFSADGSSSAAGMTASVEGSVGLPAFKLGLGFMGRSGFIMGIDLGFLLPLGSTDVEFDVHTSGSGVGGPELDAMVESTKGDIQDGADAAISLIPFIPQLNLLRIGYLF
jgi:hypothetical protein